MVDAPRFAEVGPHGTVAGLDTCSGQSYCPPPRSKGRRPCSRSSVPFMSLAD